MVQSSNDQNQKTYGIEDGVSFERRQVNRAIKKILNRGLAAARWNLLASTPDSNNLAALEI
jgi:hypothetical protein